jgi:cytochrome c oxidase assembly protein subunit 15
MQCDEGGRAWLAATNREMDMTTSNTLTAHTSAPAINASDPVTRRQMAAWLLVCCALLFAMVVVGGVTRLTHSGLSIVEWQPIVGTIPPLSQAQWEDTFAKYQQTPEYQQVNRGMSLSEFKGIFWWEYAHRLLGRGIGLVFFLPFLYFLIRRKIDRQLAWKLGGIFLLGGLQGAMGWYMVKSGLVDDPRVSQYRLTAHLGIAFLIYAAMFWVALDLLSPATGSSRDGALRGLRRFSLGLTGLIFLMVLSGGLVAGIHAGLAYNTFPLMNGHVVPPEILTLDPWYANFFSNMATVQFDHRLIAWLLAVLVPAFWLRARRLPLPRSARRATHLLLGMLGVQITLGICTLLLVVPVALAAAHQAGALLLFTSALLVGHHLLRDATAR